MKDAILWAGPEWVRAPARQVVGIGELVVSKAAENTIATHAVGSCIAVCVFDPVATVAGMLHFLLPESGINPQRAGEHPGVFADTGIPLLFQTAYSYGLVKQRAIVKLVGGAEMGRAGAAAFNTGHRNALAAKNLLWRNGVFVSGQEIGGTGARTIHMSVGDGRLQIFNGQSYKEL